jgi:hypothetical protein
MDAETIVRRYLKALETADLTAMLNLFVDQAYIDSPLYGMQPADEFYQFLFGNTIASRIRLLGVYINHDRPSQAIGYFAYYWHLKDGSRSIFDCIDIFELDVEQGKIRGLKIIYDTFHAPPSARNTVQPPPPSNTRVSSSLPPNAAPTRPPAVPEFGSPAPPTLPRPPPMPAQTAPVHTETSRPPPLPASVPPSHTDTLPPPPPVMTMPASSRETLAPPPPVPGVSAASVRQHAGDTQPPGGGNAPPTLPPGGGSS